MIHQQTPETIQSTLPSKTASSSRKMPENYLKVKCGIKYKITDNALELSHQSEKGGKARSFKPVPQAFPTPKYGMLYR